MTDATWVSLLPPLLAMFLAIWSRRVILSLAGGIGLGWTIVADWNPAAGLRNAIEEIVGVLGDGGDAKVILFTLVMGALIATLEASGGVNGFVKSLEKNRWVDSPKRAQLLAWLIGVVIFVESNITVLVAGAVCRPLFDRHKTSREKLAYIVDSTAAPICILVPMNAWGAYNIGLLAGLGVENPLTIFLQSIAMSFYAIVTVILTLIVIVFGWDFGPMRRAEERTRKGALLWPGSTPMIDASVFAGEPKADAPSRAANMIVPIATLIVMMPIGLYITGEGDMQRGSGSTSVLWASLAGLVVAWGLVLTQRLFTFDAAARIAFRGAGGLVPLALMMMLAFAMGDVAKALGTGPYVASVTATIFPPVVFLPLIFLVAAAIAFSIGSSWGTFALMLPIAVPAAMSLELPLAPFIAASLSGGIFGDHCSPISDTTVISSMAAATDHVDHVRTQLPYALVGGGIATVLFVILGATL